VMRWDTTCISEYSKFRGCTSGVVFGLPYSLVWNISGNRLPIKVNCLLTLSILIFADGLGARIMDQRQTDLPVGS
jgi:hypothetical protein